MSPYNQKLAIFKFCGWTDDAAMSRSMSLDIMREAEKAKVMVDVQLALDYSKWLQECGTCFDFYASLESRQEAFLRMFGLWEVGIGD